MNSLSAGSRVHDIPNSSDRTTSGQSFRPSTLTTAGTVSLKAEARKALIRRQHAVQFKPIRKHLVTGTAAPHDGPAFDGNPLIGNSHQPLAKTPSSEWKTWVRSEEVDEGEQLTSHLAACREKHFAVVVRHTPALSKELSSAAAYSKKYQSTVIWNKTGLKDFVAQATASIKGAYLPDTRKATSDYEDWQSEWKEQLDADSKLLGQLVDKFEEMKLTDTELKYAKIKVCDFMELLRSNQYSAQELGSLVRNGASLSILVAGLKVGLHFNHLAAATSPATFAEMSLNQRVIRFNRLVQYKQALPSESGTQFFRLAKQAFQERMSPGDLRHFDGIGAAALRWVGGGKWLDDAKTRIQAYRAQLPDMDPSAFARLAGQALDCDLPVQYLKPMLLAGVPIHRALEPDEETTKMFADARAMTTRTLAGGQSGSPVNLVTLTLGDGTHRQVVTKQLNSCPVTVPGTHMNSGIEFPFDQLTLFVEDAFERETGHQMSPEQKQEAQVSLTAAFNDALLKGNKTLEWRPAIKGWISKQPVYSAEMPPLERLPNLYGRDLAMRKLAAFLGQAELVAPVKVAIVNGVYCEVSDYNPNLGKEMLTATGDAILPLDTDDLKRAVNSMSADGLNALGWSYGFDAVQLADDGQSLRLQPRESDGTLPGRIFMNRIQADDPTVRRHHADHHTKDFLANEQDNHSGNYSQGASWDHDASFGVRQNYGAKPPKMIRSSMLMAIQDDKRWDTFKGELAGLISQKEIAALSERRTQLLEAKPQQVDDAGWGSDQVENAMGLAVIKEARKKYQETSSTDGKTARIDWSYIEKSADNRHAAPLAFHLFEWEDALINKEIKSRWAQPDRPSTAIFDDYAIRQQILAQAGAIRPASPQG